MKYVTIAALLAALVACDDTSRTEVNSDDEKDPEVVMMNPQEIFFTTPTLNDALPEIDPTVNAVEGMLRMHEDDWRQFEFISGRFRDGLDQELSEIDKIWKDHSVPLDEMGTAFRKTHVRKLIPQPIDVPLSIEEAMEMLGRDPSPMTLIGYPNALRNVHAFQNDNVVIYVVIDSGRLTTLGIEPLDQFVLPEEVLARLGPFLEKNDLRLIHWRSRTEFKTQQAAIDYLSGKKS